MDNKNFDILNITAEIISRYPFLSVSDEILGQTDKSCNIIDGLVYFTCFIETYCDQPYIVIYNPISNREPKPSNKALKEDDYWSDFNTGHYYDNDSVGKGACLVVLNLSNLRIVDIYYFKDNYCFDCPSYISGISGNYISINCFEYCYVFKDGKYLNIHYVDSQVFALSNDYWIIYPTYIYDAHCNWEVVDFKRERVYPILSLDRWYSGWCSNYEYNSCLLDVDSRALIFSQKDLSVSLPLNLLYVNEQDLDKLEYGNKGSNIGFINIPNVDNYETWQSIRDIFLDEWDERWSHMSNGLKYISLSNYYPTKYQGIISNSDLHARQIIWDFKSTSYEKHISSLQSVIDAVKSVLSDEFEELTECLTLICVPASTKMKYTMRYLDFSNKVCKDLSINNGFNYIEYISDGDAKHLGGDAKPAIRVSPFDLKNRFVILFDDVMTTGNTLKSFTQLLSDNGAIVIGAIVLGKTTYEKPNSNGHNSFYCIR